VTDDKADDEEMAVERLLSRTERPMSLQELLSSMRENSIFYQNIEAEYEVQVRSLRSEETKSASVIRHGLTTYHVIFQGMSYYARFHVIQDFTNGDRNEFVTQIGCDGERTRTNHQGKIGNINYSRVLPRSFFPPNKLGYPELSEYELADFIEFTPILAADENYKSLSIRSRVVGSDTIDGMDCVKIDCADYGLDCVKVARADYGRPQTSEPRAHTILWICPDRNFLGVRCERFWHRASATLPMVVYETSDWREVSPGVWIPFGGKSVTFDGDNLRQGLSRPNSDAHVKVTKVVLDPACRVEQFRDIEMPRDAPIYTSRDGGIVSTTVAATQQPGTSRSSQ
jgi:hypothetical protein